MGGEAGARKTREGEPRLLWPLVASLLAHAGVASALCLSTPEGLREERAPSPYASREIVWPIRITLVPIEERGRPAAEELPATETRGGLEDEPAPEPPEESQEPARPPAAPQEDLPPPAQPPAPPVETAKAPSAPPPAPAPEAPPRVQEPVPSAALQPPAPPVAQVAATRPPAPPAAIAAEAPRPRAIEKGAASGGSPPAPTTATPTQGGQGSGPAAGAGRDPDAGRTGNPPTEGRGPAAHPRGLVDAGLIRLPAPEYPPRSRRLEEQGLVLLDVEVLADGRVGQVRVLKAPGFPRLVAAAIEAARKARFKPATLEGASVTSHVELPIRFQLD